MQKILLLDIENCPHSSERLLAQLNQYAQVWLVYAKSNMSLSLDDLLQFEPYLRNNRLNLLKMPTVGKDSADFGLAFLAGRLSQQYRTSDSTFDVFSNDRAISYIVELLQQFGFNAVHLKSEIVAPSSNTAQIELSIKKKEKTETIPASQIEQHLQKLAEVLVKSQPKTTTALCNGIRVWLKIEHQQANALMLFMQQQKIIQIQNKTVQYHQQKLKQIINCSTVSTSSTSSVILSEASKEIPTLTDIQSKLHLIHIRQYCEYLQKQQGKPATQKALIRSMAAVLKIESESLLKNRFKLLKNYGILMVLEDERLVYDHQVITRWVALSSSHCINLPVQHESKQPLSLENHLSDRKQIQFEEKKQRLQSSDFMDHEQKFIQTLRNRLNLPHGLKPKYIAGFSVLLEQLFPQLSVETCLSILEKNELIQINNREIVYSPALTGS